MKRLICRVRGHRRDYPPPFGWHQPNPCRLCGRTLPGQTWLPDEATARAAASGPSRKITPTPEEG